MGSDRARVSFEPSRQWRAVIAQQGRVSLEADINEQVAIDASRDQLTTLELVGPCASPDGGYQVSTASAGDLSVSAGTLYLGGQRLRLEQAIAYSHQPEWLNAATDPLYTPPAVPEGDAFELVYLLAGEQEVSAVEDPTLADVALGGPDTAQRLRIVQRVVRTPSKSSARASAWSELESSWASEGYGFDPATMQRISTATLQVSFTQEQTEPTPCQPVATGGYLEAENQLLRVAIGVVEDGQPSILWAFDDACALYRVTASVYDAAANQTTITLASAPVDASHYPAEGQTVELLADAVDLSSESAVAAPSGFLATLAKGYEPGERTVVLSGQPPVEYLQAAPSQAQATPSLYLRVWQEQVAASPGAPVPLGKTGVAVTLSSSDGVFHTGDFWRFALRPIEPTIVYPARIKEAPQAPDGPRTWACPLSVISWSDGTPTSSSCVEGFDSLLKLSQDVGGCCTVVLRPADVEDGASLAALLAGYASKGPVTVCLEPGTYTLSQPLILGPEHEGLTLQACRGAATLAAPASPGQEFLLGLVVIAGAKGVTLQGLELELPLVDFAPAAGAFTSLTSQNSALLDGYTAKLAVAIGVTVQGADDASITGCHFAFPQGGEQSLFAAGVYASGTVERLSLSGCGFALAPAPTSTPFADLAKGASAEPPYQVAFGYLHVPTAAETSSAAETGTTTPTVPVLRNPLPIPPAVPVLQDPALKPEALAASLPTTTIKDPVLDPTVPVTDPSAPIADDPIVKAPIADEPVLDPSAPVLQPTEPIEPTFPIKPIIPPIPPVAPSGAGTAESTIGAATGEQAASLASLTLPTLHDALIEGCVFEGLTVPVLGLAHLGTIRVERNTIRDCYGGVWLVSLQDTGVMTMFDQIAVGESSLWTDFKEAGTTALLDRIYVLAFAIGQVLPITPPSGLLKLPPRIIGLPSSLELERVQHTLGNIFTVAEGAGASGTSAPLAEPRIDLAGTGGIVSRLPIVPQFSLKAFPNVGNLIERLGTETSPAPPPIEAVETGESVLLRLVIADSQIDAVVEDSYSGAGIVVVDLTSTPGSLLFNGNRVRARFPEGQAALVSTVAEAALTGSILANEVATACDSLVLQPATPAAAPVALTGNVLVSPAKLPERHESGSPPPWSALNALVNYTAPSAPASGSAPAAGEPAGGSGST
jgi:hypothetical protein